MERAAKPALFAVAMALWIGAPFAGAGRLDWYRAWICVALYSICMPAIGVIVRRINPQVVEARKQLIHSNTKPFDKAFYAAYLPLVYIQPLAAGLDVVRYRGWSMPYSLVYVSAPVLVLSMALIAWAMAVNRFAETSVRIQADRGHSVVTWGPYRWVRHPFYLGAIFMYIATAVILGSVWALAIAGVIMILFIVRTALEDRMLRTELPGYADYSLHTRYRLFPTVW